MDGLRRRASSPTFTIGRKAKNDLPLPFDSKVSAEHARIVRDGGHYWLEDLGSRNGTLIGDERISSRILIGPGTLFTVGLSCLEFMPR